MSIPFVHDVFSLPAPFQHILKDLKGSFSSSWRPLSQDCNFLKPTVLSAARGTGLRASQTCGIVSACLLPTSCHQRETQFSEEVLVFSQAIGFTVTLRQWMECSVKSFFLFFLWKKHSSASRVFRSPRLCRGPALYEVNMLWIQNAARFWIGFKPACNKHIVLYNRYKIPQLSQICTAEIDGNCGYVST